MQFMQQHGIQDTATQGQKLRNIKLAVTEFLSNFEQITIKCSH
jgi:hypothetical protein